MTKMILVNSMLRCDFEMDEVGGLTCSLVDGHDNLVDHHALWLHILFSDTYGEPYDVLAKCPPMNQVILGRREQLLTLDEYIKSLPEEFLIERSS